MTASLVVLSKRPPDWSHERFTIWWRGEHADMGKQLPQLLTYRHGDVVHDYDHPDDAAWDGHAVLTFPDRAALDAALVSPEWAAAVAHVGKMKGKRIALITDEVDLLRGGNA